MATKKKGRDSLATLRAEFTKLRSDMARLARQLAENERRRVLGPEGEGAAGHSSTAKPRHLSTLAAFEGARPKLRSWVVSTQWDDTDPAIHVTVALCPSNAVERSELVRALNAVVRGVVDVKY